MATDERKLYTYDGPVKQFGETIGKFSGTTTASSKLQAMNNLSYQAKMKKGFTKDAKIELDISLLQVNDNNRIYVQPEKSKPQSHIKDDPNQLKIKF